MTSSRSVGRVLILLLIVAALGAVAGNNIALVLGVAVAAAVVAIVVKMVQRLLARRRAISLGYDVRRQAWGRWSLRVLALGLLAATVGLVATRPRTSFLSGRQRLSLGCPFSPWDHWRGTYLSLAIVPHQASFLSCTAAVSDRWHLAWVVGIGALALLVTSLLPSPYRDVLPDD